MKTIPTLGEILQARGVSRRGFLKYCSATASLLALPPALVPRIANALEQARDTVDGGDVRLNDPFKGGFITREHGREMPWLQIELSRAPIYTDVEKRDRVLDAITGFVERVAT